MIRYPPIVPMDQEIPDACRSCEKFKEPSQCGKCGCPSEAKALRFIKDIKICPIKKWMRGRTTPQE